VDRRREFDFFRLGGGDDEEDFDLDLAFVAGGDLDRL
jgi:hypothetical protein